MTINNSIAKPIEPDLASSLERIAIIRFAPEVIIKSPQVKRKFVNRLEQNIRFALDQHGFQYELQRHWSKFTIFYNDEKLLPVLQRVYGISSISPVEVQSQPELDSLIEAVQLYRPKLKDKSFRVRVKRAGGVKVSSQEYEAKLGAALIDAAASVNLDNPDVSIEIELAEKQANIFTTRLPGLNGLPLGSQGRALCLLSGGFDSAVAAWYMMRRGVELDFLLINLGGDEQLREVLKVANVLAERWIYGRNSRLWVISADKLPGILQASVSPSYVQVVLKVLFYQLGTEVAKKIPGNMAIVTGESIGQVSSQTLKNLAAISQSTSYPVLQPLLCFEKEEIIRCSRQIGLFDACKSVKEYCAIVPRKPVTAADEGKLAQQLSQLDPGLVDELLGQLSCLDLPAKELGQSDRAALPIHCESIPEEALVIDCRDRKSYEQWHLPNALFMDMNMLMKAFPSFAKDKTYVLYCEYGLQTAYIAEKMRKIADLRAFSYKGGAYRLKKDFAKSLSAN